MFSMHDGSITPPHSGVNFMSHALGQPNPYDLTAEEVLAQLEGRAVSDLSFDEFRVFFAAVASIIGVADADFNIQAFVAPWTPA